MKKLKIPVFLKIESEEQLNVLNDALTLLFDMENDAALDELVTSASEVRKLAILSDAALEANLDARRENTDSRLDNLLSINILQHNLQNIVDKLPE